MLLTLNPKIMDYYDELNPFSVGKKTNIVNLLKSLDDINISSKDIDFGKDSVYIKKTKGAYYFGFMANYTKDYNSYVSETTTNPEEWSLEINFTDITDVEIYVNGEFIELDDYELDDVTKIIRKKLEEI